MGTRTFAGQLVIGVGVGVVFRQVGERVFGSVAARKL